jgi:hypothetical protein
MLETLFRLNELEVAYRGEKFVIIDSVLSGIAKQVPAFPPEVAKGEAGQGVIRLQNADPMEVFKMYASISGRELVDVPPPWDFGKVTFRSQRPLTKGETLYALEALGIMNSWKFEKVGEKQVKVISLRPAAKSRVPKGDFR